MQLAARWVVLVAALAGAAVLNLDVDDATLALEATDATDIDAYVASLRLPRLEGAGCAANDAPCVRKVVADALRAAAQAVQLREAVPPRRRWQGVRNRGGGSQPDPFLQTLK